MNERNRDLFVSGRSNRDKKQSETEKDQGKSGNISSQETKGGGEEVLTVSELTNQLQSLIERRMGHLWVQGEISNLSQPSSGHVYFDVKDEDTVLPVVLFRRYASQVSFDLEDGQEVKLYGLVSIYEKRGNYQLIARKVKPAGEGTLLLAFKKLCAKLEDEGLFDERHKREIPSFPNQLGIVTSPTGAAVRDMIRTIRKRFPCVSIQIYPAKVQGDEAAEEISRGVSVFNQRDEVDVIIVGRGGGSLEDLWAFNDESLARTIFSSSIPVVSAVGHEVDVTVSDKVADKRVPTPTAAGQFVVPERTKQFEKFQERFTRVTRALKGILRDKSRHFKSCSSRLKSLHPDKQLKQKQEMLQQKTKEVLMMLDQEEQNLKRRWRIAGERLESLSPLSVLDRGYSIARKEKTGKVLKDVSRIDSGDRISVRIRNGIVRGEVLEKEHSGKLEGVEPE